MRYLNVILTLIAILLIIIILQHRQTIISRADNGIQDINIRQVGGIELYDKYLSVKE